MTRALTFYRIQLMRLLVGLLMSFSIVWYDFPTNSPTNDTTNNRINWIWMSKKIGLQTRIYCKGFF